LADQSSLEIFGNGGKREGRRVSAIAIRVTRKDLGARAARRHGCLT
jgi:hypothetical protein